MEVWTSATGSGPKMIHWPNKWALIQLWAGWESGPWARTGWNHGKKTHSQEPKNGIWQGRHSAKANQVNTREAGRKQILEARQKIKYNLAKTDPSEATYCIYWLNWHVSGGKQLHQLRGMAEGKWKFPLQVSMLRKGCGLSRGGGAGQTVTRPT